MSSVNNRKQRNHLYGITFLEWKVEQRLSELEKTSIESTLAIHKFGNRADKASFAMVCEKLSDYETMIEVAEETFPALRPEMDRIKRAKLMLMKKRVKVSDESTKIEEEAANINDVIEGQKVKKKSFWNSLMFWK